MWEIVARNKKKIDQLDKADIKSEVTGKGFGETSWSNGSKGVQTYVINNLNKGLINSGCSWHVSVSKQTLIAVSSLERCSMPCRIS